MDETEQEKQLKKAEREFRQRIQAMQPFLTPREIDDLVAEALREPLQ